MRSGWTFRFAIPWRLTGASAIWWPPSGRPGSHSPREAALRWPLAPAPDLDLLARLQSEGRGGPAGHPRSLPLPLPVDLHHDHREGAGLGYASRYLLTGTGPKIAPWGSLGGLAVGTEWERDPASRVCRQGSL